MSRADRSRAERRRRRSLRRRALVALLIAAALMVATVIIGNALRKKDTGVSGAGASDVQPGVRTNLVAIDGDDGSSATVMLLAAGTDGATSTVVQIPGALEMEVPGLDRQPVSGLSRLGGAATLRLGIENLLGVRVDETTVIPPADAKAALTSTGALTIDLRNPVDLSAVPGGRKFPDGRQRVSASEAWLLLTTVPPGGERDHLDAARSVLTAWSLSGGNRSALPPEVAAIARSHAAFQTLPVQPSGVGDIERFTLDRAAAPIALKRWFPGALQRLGPGRPKLEIRNGSGAVGVTQAAATVVVPLGTQVVLTGNVLGFGVTASEVDYYRIGDRAAAHAVAKALGIDNVKRVENNVNVVDITVILGSDFQGPEPTATTATP